MHSTAWDKDLLLATYKHSNTFETHVLISTYTSLAYNLLWDELKHECANYTHPNEYGYCILRVPMFYFDSNTARPMVPL